MLHKSAQQLLFKNRSLSNKLFANSRAFSAAPDISGVLKDKMSEVIAKRQDEVKAFNKEHGKTKIADITVGQVIGGMRGMPGMMYETSKLHPVNGINYRGYDLYQIRE